MSFGLLGAQSGCRAVNHGIYMLSGPPPTEVINIDFPPIEVPGKADSAAMGELRPVWVVSPIDGWAYGFRVELTDDKGDTVPSALLHHVKVMTPNRRELFSPIMLRLVGAGSETRSGGVPRSVGVPIQKGDSLVATAMIHNESEMAFHQVRLRVQLEVTPATVNAPEPEAVYPFFLHVASPAGHSEFDLPPGRSERSWDASPAVAGEIVGFGGHAHRYAVELRFHDVETGRVLWRSRVQNDADGNVVEIPRTIYGTGPGPSIFPDRVYRLTAVYDNPTDETLFGEGMGTMAGVVRPTGHWPDVDRRDALYLLDRAREIEMSAMNPDHRH